MKSENKIGEFIPFSGQQTRTSSSEIQTQTSILRKEKEK